MPACEKGMRILQQAVDQAVSESVLGGRVTVIRECDHVSDAGYALIPCEMAFIAVAQDGVLKQAGIYDGHYCADLETNKPYVK